MAPLWLDHKNFLQATLYEKVRFCQKMGKFAISIEHSKAKSFSLTP